MRCLNRTPPGSSLNTFNVLFRQNFSKLTCGGTKLAQEGRKEVKLDFFEREEIPLLPLVQQKAIIARWRKAHKEVFQAGERLKKQKATINARFLADLGLSTAACSIDESLRGSIGSFSVGASTSII